MNDFTNTYTTDRAGHDITRSNHVAAEKVDNPKPARQASSGKVVAKSSARVAREASGPYPPKMLGMSPSELRAAGQRTIYTPDVAPSGPLLAPAQHLNAQRAALLAQKANGVSVPLPQKGNKKPSSKNRPPTIQQTSAKATSPAISHAIPAEAPRPAADAAAAERMRRMLEPFEDNAMEWATALLHCQSLRSTRNRDGSIRERRIYFDYEFVDDAADEALEQLHLLEGAFHGLLAVERQRRGEAEMQAILQGEYIGVWCPSHCIQIAAKTLKEIEAAIARVKETVKAQEEEGSRLLAQAVRDGWMADEDWVGPVEASSSNV